MTTIQVRPTGPTPAKIMIVGEFPGQAEVAKGLPFQGWAGQEFSKMLNDAKIIQSLCFMTNVIRVQPPENNAEFFIPKRKRDVTIQHVCIQGKMVLPCVVDGIELLKREIEQCQPNVIIAVGEVALWALTGNSGIVSWRGSQLLCNLPLALPYAPKVIPIYHPSIVMKKWEWRPVVVHDLKRAKRESEFRELKKPEWKFITRPNFQQVEFVLQTLISLMDSGQALKVACDVETRNGHIACIGIAWSKTEALCIPLMCVERVEGYWTEEEEFLIILLLQQLLCHKNVAVIGQNFLYDAQYFFRWLLFIPRLVRDTMISQHSCFSNQQKGLDFLSSMYCEFYSYWKDDGKTWDEATGEDQLWTYNCEDCVRTYEVDDVLIGVVKQLRVETIHNFQQSLFYPVLETMLHGIRIDTTKRSTYFLSLSDEIAKREQYFIDVLGHPLNPRSTPQMQKLFYEDFRQKPILNRKTGSISCDDESLNKIAAREPLLSGLVRRILEYRSLGVFSSTFVQAPLDIDGRMRCSFNIAGTETYRFSSSTNAFGSGLNLQNIPKGGESDSGDLELPNIRELFIPDNGYGFFDIDLSSADLRIVVWEADEPEMKAMLKQGLDPYTEIAKEHYRDQSLTKKDPRRQLFKSFAHGTNYLGTAKGLAERLGLSVAEAERTQKWYFSRFPKIKKWQDQLKSNLDRFHFVENVFGYRCYFMTRIEGTVYNQAAAWVPQSTVGCLINRGYVNIYNNLKAVKVLLQVHDSLAGQYPLSMESTVIDEIVKQCSIELPYADPLIIPVGIKTSHKSWGDCE